MHLLFALSALVLANAELAPLYNTDAPNVIKGSFLVELVPGSVGLSASTLSSGIKIVKNFQIGQWRALHVQVEDGFIDVLRADSNVHIIEADAMSAQIDCQEHFAGDDVWGLSRTSAREMPDYESSVYQWLEDSDGQGVDVYIVDTGIYVEHNDFGGRARHGMTSDGIGGGEQDQNGHGTHVGGTAAGTQYGVAKSASLIAVKVLGATGSGSASTIVQGVEWVGNQHANNPNPNAKSVMNMSLGISPPSEILEAAVNATVDAGVVTAVSARNNNRDSCVDSPSRLEKVLTCAASDIDDMMASFTNYGPCVDVIAPGVSVLSADIGNPDASSRKSGTSMSAPHVAGMAARILSSSEAVLTPPQVREVIVSTASVDQINLEAPKDTTPNLLLFGACEDF